MNKKDNWIELGFVGVDSGKLMIVDPCYMKNEWQEEEFDDTRQYRDKKTGKIYEWQKDFQKYDETIPDYDRSPKELIKNGTWEKIHRENNNFSYNGVCHTGNKQYKQMNYKAGHPGVAVCFNSGDGQYPVMGRLDEDGRVIEVVIDMS